MKSFWFHPDLALLRSGRVSCVVHHFVNVFPSLFLRLSQFWDLSVIVIVWLCFVFVLFPLGSTWVLVADCAMLCLARLTPGSLFGIIIRMQTTKGI